MARTSGRRGWRRAARAVLVAVLALAGVVVVAAAAFMLSLPGVGDAPTKVAAVVASHHGTLAGPPPPTKLGAAVVAVEDEHFYSNAVVNVLDGVGRAALAALHGGGDPGGSTIAQQLAKQLYGDEGGVWGTLKDIGLGLKLSRTYSRAHVLSMYLDAVYYGNGYWGDVAAARGYFGVDPGQLDWAEAAMLAGLPQSPSAYDPVRHYHLAKLRQRHVLDRLVVNRYLTTAQADAAYRAPLPLQGPGHVKPE